MPDVSKRVKEIIAEQAGVEEGIIKDENTFDDLGADSLDQVEIIMALEEEYDVEIPGESVEGCDTVGKLVEKMQELVG
jgi:acyl carrier protein